MNIYNISNIIAEAVIGHEENFQADAVEALEVRNYREDKTINIGTTNQVVFSILYKTGSNLNVFVRRKIQN